MDTILQLAGVSAGYDHRVILRDINFTLRPLEFVGITGPNGGGKTTLLKLLLGLLQPLAGQITYNAPRTTLFGYLPQNNRFDNRFPITVEEVVLSGLGATKGIGGRYTRRDKQLARRLLREHGVDDLRARPVGELSGGQAQRVFLCRALVSSPRVLVLDEPTAHVDAAFAAAFHRLLAELNREITIIMVSHDLHATRALATRVLRVEDGKCQND
ncbi:MAG: ATP-binding cassette domain-containing protein [Odoribacteraceae bacterium]|nr:ATP-binding cassette domain-containing protein [Odoribacteraceae bacterium]